MLSACRARWSGKTNTDVPFATCEAIIDDRCVELGDGGGRPVLGWLSEVSDSGHLPCSGHGTCTTSVVECGYGTVEDSATPCCSCDLGFAGVGCAVLDVRVYIGMGVVATLLVLLVAMTVGSIKGNLAERNKGKRNKGDLAEPLLDK